MIIIFELKLETLWANIFTELFFKKIDVWEL